MAKIEQYHTHLGVEAEALRVDVSAALQRFQSTVEQKAQDLGVVETLYNAFRGLPEKPQRQQVRTSVASIFDFSRSAGDWNREFETPEAFESWVKIIAKKYSDERATPSDRDDQFKNFVDGLVDKADQALAAKSVFDELTEKAEALHPITPEDKNQAAFQLAATIRTHGAALYNQDSRIQLIEDGVLSPEVVEAILRSNLVVGAEGVTPQYNTQGFKNDQEWDQAVLKTAAGILEADLLSQLQEVSQTDLNVKILEKADQIYRTRTVIDAVAVATQEVVEEVKRVEADKAVTIHEPVVEADGSGDEDRLLQAVEQASARVEQASQAAESKPKILEAIQQILEASQPSIPVSSAPAKGLVFRSVKAKPGKNGKIKSGLMAAWEDMVVAGGKVRDGLVAFARNVLGWVLSSWASFKGGFKEGYARAFANITRRLRLSNKSSIEVR